MIEECWLLFLGYPIKDMRKGQNQDPTTEEVTELMARGSIQVTWEDVAGLNDFEY